MALVAVHPGGNIDRNGGQTGGVQERDRLTEQARHGIFSSGAEGLNNLALELDRLRNARMAPILTPHPGEMARLIGKNTAAVNADRIETARGFALAHRCHLILKGARTVIATADGKVLINPTGNPGMASGGMGDVLAGIIAALLGQGLSPEDAMKLGVYVHGYIGDRVAESKGPIGLLASDIVERLPRALGEFAALPS